MNQHSKSIRPFIGAKDFEESKNFYTDLGFQELVISKDMSYFNITRNIGFYLQNAYVKDWIDNTMLFVEVEDVEEYYKKLQKLDLPSRYKNVRIIPIRYEEWGSECFLHDPSGILWHFGIFKK